eukprot:scaffold27073_cov146-Skeletonema_marinoi.AAC.2
MVAVIGKRRLAWLSGRVSMVGDARASWRFGGSGGLLVKAVRHVNDSRVHTTFPELLAYIRIRKFCVCVTSKRVSYLASGYIVLYYLITQVPSDERQYPLGCDKLKN